MFKNKTGKAAYVAYNEDEGVVDMLYIHVETEEEDWEQGHGIKDIAKVLDVSPRTVIRWLNTD